MPRSYWSVKKYGSSSYAASLARASTRAATAGWLQRVGPVLDPDPVDRATGGRASAMSPTAQMSGSLVRSERVDEHAVVDVEPGALGQLERWVAHRPRRARCRPARAVPSARRTPVARAVVRRDLRDAGTELEGRRRARGAGRRRPVAISGPSTADSGRSAASMTVTSTPVGAGGGRRLQPDPAAADHDQPAAVSERVAESRRSPSTWRRSARRAASAPGTAACAARTPGGQQQLVVAAAARRRRARPRLAPVSTAVAVVAEPQVDLVARRTSPAAWTTTSSRSARCRQVALGQRRPLVGPVGSVADQRERGRRSLPRAAPPPPWRRPGLPRRSTNSRSLARHAHCFLDALECRSRMTPASARNSARQRGSSRSSPQQRRGDRARAGGLHAAQRHADVLGLDDDADAAGSSWSCSQSATWLVSRSCTCGRRANCSTTRASLDRPRMRSPGR